MPAGHPAEMLHSASNRSRFRLVPYFTAASLAAFLLVSGALWFFEREQEAGLRELQSRQMSIVKKAQDEFATRQEEAARHDLLAVHEAGNVNLARILANALWDRDFAPFIARAAGLPVDPCRALPDAIEPVTAVAQPTAEKKACFAEIGRMLRAFPEYPGIDSRLFAAMAGSTVFKFKVFDLRGITVYSSEHAQMGEDKMGNAGWLGAARDQLAMSELIFRDRFSAFEGIVENRNLISSYVPVRAYEGGPVVAVFEIYSDVTPFLAHIRQAFIGVRKAAADNQTMIEAAAHETEEKLGEETQRMLVFIMLAFGFLFIVLFVIVRRAAGIMDAQERERDRAHQQLAQSEKMASLGQMVAGVAHQLNTPLAFSYNNVQMAMQALEHYRAPLKFADACIRAARNADGDTVTFDTALVGNLIGKDDHARPDVETPRAMLLDTLQGIEQMRELVDNLREFTRLDRNAMARFDVSRSLRNVLYIARSVLPTAIHVVEDLADVPPVNGNVSQMNQVFINLVNNAAQAIEGAGTITVRSALDGDHIRIDVEDTGSGIAPENLPHIWDDYFTTKPIGQGTGLGLTIARTIVAEHGGTIRVVTRNRDNPGTIFSVYLPIAK